MAITYHIVDTKYMLHGQDCNKLSIERHSSCILDKCYYHLSQVPGIAHRVVKRSLQVLPQNWPKIYLDYHLLYLK